MIKRDVFRSFFALLSVFIILIGCQSCSQENPRPAGWPNCEELMNSRESVDTVRTYKSCYRAYYSAPLFLPPGAEQGMRTFTRIINPSNRAVRVSITVFNNTGDFFGPVFLSVAANSTVEFDSNDLSEGNTDLGWTGLNLTNQDFLRLELSSNMDLIVRTYIHTAGSDTNQASVHSLEEVKEDSGTQRSFVIPIYFFNPASNTTFQSQLRLINPTTSDIRVVIKGVDDGGNSGDQDVTFTLQPEQSKLITARQLEGGDSSFTGRFGDGEGRWQLSIESDIFIQAMNLMRTPGKLFTIDSPRQDRSPLPYGHTKSDLVKKLTGISVPLFLPPGIEQGMRTFTRIFNPSNRAATASITVFNNAGDSFGPVSLSVAASSTVEFDSNDLSEGNTDLGWTGLNITNQGFLRLKPSSNMDIMVRTYIHAASSDTNQASIHSLGEVKKVSRIRIGSFVMPVYFFNPASNTTFQSQLRLINPTISNIHVVIKGVDDGGNSGDQDVTFTLQPGQSKLITARQLEGGDSSFTGRFGDGEGRWRLSIESDSFIQVMNLMRTPGRIFSL